MNKFILGISTLIVIVFSVSCASTKRQIKSASLTPYLRQKIENRDFTVDVKRVSSMGDDGVITTIRNIRISGDSLISNMGAPYNSEFKDGDYYTLIRTIKPRQKFSFVISDYKVKNDNQNNVEVTFNHELWSYKKNKLITRLYKMIINNERKVEIYLDNHEWPWKGEMQ